MPFFLEKETNRIQFYEFLYKKDLKKCILQTLDCFYSLETSLIFFRSRSPQ